MKLNHLHVHCISYNLQHWIIQKWLPLIKYTIMHASLQFLYFFQGDSVFWLECKLAFCYINGPHLVIGLTKSCYKTTQPLAHNKNLWQVWDWKTATLSSLTATKMLIWRWSNVIRIHSDKLSPVEQLSGLPLWSFFDVALMLLFEAIVLWFDLYWFWVQSVWCISIIFRDWHEGSWNVATQLVSRLWCSLIALTSNVVSELLKCQVQFKWVFVPLINHRCQASH